MPMPKRREARQRVCLTLDPAVYKKLQDQARASDTSVSRVVEAAARRGLHLPEPPPPLPPVEAGR